MIFTDINRLAKTVVLIDGANCQMAFRQMGEKSDWAKIRTMLNTSYNIIHFRYYTALLTDADGRTPLKGLTDWLSFNGFLVRTKEAKQYTNGDVTKTKGNMDIELAVDMVLSTGYAEQVFLFSGDADFVYAVNEVQQRGVRVVAFSVMQQSQVPMIGEGLRKQVDTFINIAEHKDLFCKRDKEDATETETNT